MASVALPAVRSDVPRDMEPSKNCTVPVAPAGETLAVKVTVCPFLDGSELEASVVVVLALFTDCVSVEEALPV